MRGWSWTYPSSTPPSGLAPGNRRLYLAALLVVHVAGVLRYQATKGDALGRMGLRLARRPGVPG